MGIRQSLTMHREDVCTIIGRCGHAFVLGITHRMEFVPASVEGFCMFQLEECIGLGLLHMMRQLLQLLFTSAWNATALMAMAGIVTVTDGSSTNLLLLTTLVANPPIGTALIATGELVSTDVGLLLCWFILCGLR